MWFDLVGFDMSQVSSVSDLPKDNNHVYHLTSARNEHDILVEGIKSSPTVGKWRRVNDFLRLVRDEESITVGLDDRSECVFCFARFGDISSLSGENMVFAVDLRELDSTAYRASYHKVTRVNEVLQDKSAMSVEDAFESRIVDADLMEAYELSVAYWNGMERVCTPVNKGGEIIVSGDIPAHSITTYTK